MTMIPIESIHVSDHNARRVASDPARDLELRASIAAIRMVQPLAVVPRHDGGYTLIAGHRRLAAAQELGWTEVPVIDISSTLAEGPTAVLAASAAENMVRAAMHPVDQWRAITALTSDGYTLDGAAQALGLSPALARRLDHLGRMAPELVDALAAEQELPDQRSLRVIAMAPHDVQLKAFTQAAKRGGVDWNGVATRCSKQRISLSHAIFDPAAADVVFDEDLFAEPGGKEQFTTTDLTGFIAAQQKALEARAEASNGRIVVAPWKANKPLRQRLPEGWEPTWDATPKRWRKDDKRKVFCCVDQEAWNLGTIESVVATPALLRAAAAGVVPSDTVSDIKRPPISKATYNRLAALKTEAVRERLPMVAANENPADWVRLLLLVLSFDNVSLFDCNSRYGTGPYHDLPSKLLDEDGRARDLDEADLCRLAADVIARVVQFSGPDISHASGVQAEWLAAMVGAHMPRCDTEEILKGVSGDMLTELAREHGIDDTGKVSDIRRRLVGHLPDWRPVDFGADGPGPYDTDDLEAAE